MSFAIASRVRRLWASVTYMGLYWPDVPQPQRPQRADYRLPLVMRN